MPNPIKYSTGSETNALKKGNFFFGTGDVGKGPSDVTGYYQGVAEIKFAEYNNPTFWYIEGDFTEAVGDEPESFQVFPN
jgi:hypothetical protein